VCGDVVCGDYKKGCSMIVPIGVLFNLMSVSMKIDDDVKAKVEQALKIDQVGLRVCMGCKKKVLAKKVFMMDTEKGKHSELMSFQRLWKLLQAKVETEDLTYILDDDENVRLVALFTRLDKLIKDIDKEVNEPNNLQLRRDEIRILQNLKSVIITYVQTKLPILRKAQDEKLARERQGLQNMISDQPKLTKSEIREKREKLMVLNEQRFLVESMYEEFKKQRRFDDLKTLDSNLIDIDTEIEQLTIELGDESFTA
jgi:rabenosyn-5